MSSMANDAIVLLQVALGILKRTGYSQVTTVMDGQQAMDVIQQRGGADAFDIILTDLHMPRKVCPMLKNKSKQFTAKY